MALLGVRNAKYTKVTDDLDIKVGESMSNIDAASSLNTKRKVIGAEFALEHSSAEDDPASTDIGTTVKNLAAYTKHIDKSKRSSMKNTAKQGGVGFSSSIHDESVEHLPSVKIKPTSG